MARYSEHNIKPLIAATEHYPDERPFCDLSLLFDGVAVWTKDNVENFYHVFIVAQEKSNSGFQGATSVDFDTVPAGAVVIRGATDPRELKASSRKGIDARELAL